MEPDREPTDDMYKFTHFWFVGLTRSLVDNCLYYRVEGNKVLYLVLYVDDMFIFSNSLILKTTLLEYIRTKFVCKDLGEIKEMVGMKVRRITNGFIMEQTDLIMLIANEFLNTTELTKRQYTPQHLETPQGRLSVRPLCENRKEGRRCELT